MSTLEVSLAYTILSGTFGDCSAHVGKILLLKGSLTLPELFEAVQEECGMSFDMLTSSLLILLQQNLVLSVLSIPGVPSNVSQSTPVSGSGALGMPMTSSGSVCETLAGMTDSSVGGGGPQIPSELYWNLRNGVSGWFKYEAVLSEILCRIRLPRYAAYVEKSNGRDARVLFCQFAKFGRISMSKAVAAAAEEYSKESCKILISVFITQIVCRLSLRIFFV